MTARSLPALSPVQVRVLLAAAALSSSVSLVLELMLITQASYLLGDHALATGVVVGTFLAAMGLGAWVSQFLATGPDPGLALLQWFLGVELALAPLCLLAPLGLFALFRLGGPVWLALVVFTVLVGALGGMEVPLLTRLLECGQQLRVALARVLALDYLGALVGALLFPLVLLPWLGLLPTAGLLALMPLVSCVVIAAVFPVGRLWRRSIAVAVPVVALAGLGLVPLGDRIEDGLYEDPVVSRIQSRHQRIVLTRRRDDLRLFLDGQLQFSSLDEYRYHEALVHPAMAWHGRPARVLLLGAGDGLALREVLRWPAVRQVDVLELDPAVAKLAREQPFLRRLNGASFEDARVRLVIGDAFERVRQLQGAYDVIIADFPDPATPALARLYSVTFYGRLLRRLAADGLLVTQASTPFFSPRVLASIQATLAELRLTTRPYGVDVPSFGPWGFVMAHRGPARPAPAVLPFQGRWIDQGQLQRLFPLSRDLALPPGERVLPNRLHRPVLADYQRQGRWREN